jgi:lipooligosaccharide transport system ATP-binding protein
VDVAAPADNAITLGGVVKRFGPVTAVDGLELDVPRGICLGLLGPNGAGKSTTMKLLTGQAIPSTSSPAGCAAACCSLAASSTSRS